MRHTRPAACLSLGLLRHVRDARPSEAELLAWLGPDAGVFHVLRKAGLLVVTEGRVVLSPEHLSADGAVFRYENRRFRLDADEEWVI